MAGKAGRSGRKKKPYGMKVLEGTAKPGDRPAVEFPEVENDAPPYFILNDEHAMREWDHLFPLLKATRVMTEADRTQLGLMCANFSDVVKTRLAGSKPTASDKNSLRADYAEFGLTPASRGRVKPVAEGEAKNQFNQLRKAE